MPTLDNLIGRRSEWDSILSWLEGWASGSKPEVYPFIIAGESGWGKTTLAHATTEQCGFAPTSSELGWRDKNEIKRWFGACRSTSFDGRARCAVLDDASFLSAPEWKIIARGLKSQAFPCIICVQSLADVPWSIRRGAGILKLAEPTNEFLERYLLSIDPDRNDTESISSVTRSFRAARNLMMTMPDGFPIDEIEAPPISRSGWSEVEAILSGRWTTDEFDSHPLSILSAGIHNGVHPEIIGTGLVLHGASWKTDGLTPIASAYLATFRSKNSDKPPFRVRKGGNHKQSESRGIDKPKPLLADSVRIDRKV
jgi:hypothetical protein